MTPARSIAAIIALFLAGTARAAAPAADKIAAALKADDPAARLKAIDDTVALGDQAEPLLDTLIDLLADRRLGNTGATSPYLASREFVCNSAACALRQLGPTAIPALAKALFGTDGPRASLAAQGLVIVLASSDDEILRSATGFFPTRTVDFFAGSDHGMITPRGLRCSRPNPDWGENVYRRQREVEQSRFKIWVQTLRAEKLAHGQRPADGVELLTLMLDCHYAFFADAFTRDKLAKIAKGQEWKLMAEQLVKADPAADRIASQLGRPRIGFAAAVSQLAGAGGKDALSALFDLLRARPDDIAICQAIASIGQPAVDKILEFASIEKRPLADSARGIMGQLNDPLAVPALLRNLDNSSVHIRMIVVTGLAHIGDPRAAAPLVDLLASEKEDSTRCSIMAALESVRDPEHRAAKPVADLLLHGRSVALRQQAAKSLMRFCDPQFSQLGILAQALSDESWEVRFTVADVFYGYAHLAPAADALPQLEKLAQGDPEPRVRDIARSAISQIEKHKGKDR